ncbi:MAG TPA: ABC transporter ATP-binding protein [Anaerolineales bacterium]|nr:ABC transporter ATP-binding protein [Anaerolineales bacterium]
MQPMIEAHNLLKRYGDNLAVAGASLTIDAGEIYGLVGPDGAGKTTTLRMLVGAIKADGGDCAVAGHDLATATEAARAQLGYLSQRFSLYEDLTVLENIRFFAEVRGMRSNEWLPRCMEILEFVGMAGFKDRRAGQLSGGMRQKLGLASALVARPRVLLLDEPTTGVDPVTRQDFWQLIVALVSTRAALGRHPEHEAPAEPVTVLLTTPYMDEAARCHRVGFMHEGRIVAEDTPTRFRSRLVGRIWELRGSPLPLLRQIAQAEHEVETVHAFGDRLHLRTRGGEVRDLSGRLRKQAEVQGARIEALRAIPPLLEDVFILLAEHGRD